MKSITVALNVGKILFIIVSMFLTGCKSDNNLVQETKIDNVKIELTFMAYSCGDCVDLYRIDKVISSESNEKKFFLNKEIEVEFYKVKPRVLLKIQNAHLIVINLNVKEKFLGKAME